MNERIQQMYKRAHAHAWDMACKSRHGPGDVPDRQMWEWETDKLVEQVLQECLDNLYLNGYDDAALSLQKHFKELDNERKD